MNEIVKINAAEFGLEETKAQEISALFKPMLDQMVVLEKEFNVIAVKDITEEVCAEAAELRRRYVKTRTGTAAIHQELKKFYLQGGRFVDSWKNAQLLASQDAEEKLKGIEKHYENIEKEKVAKLQEARALEMGKYQDELDYIPDNLGGMPENIWANYLVGVKHSYEVQKEAEVKAEKERIAKEKAEIAEQKRIKAENIKLQKEAEERERLAKIEKEKRDKIEAERIKKENAGKLAREKETKRLQDKANAILKKEREEREKVEAELEVKKLEEERAKSERLANLEAELNKGDSDKVKDLISDLNLLKTKYSFKSVKNKKVYKDVALLIDKIVEHIHKA